MKNRMLSATLLASLLLVFPLSANLFGQQPSAYSANVTKYKMAVLDISAVFKNYQAFKAQLDGIKQEVAATENTLKAERQRILKLQEQLRTFNPGTDEFKKLDEKIASAQANFKLTADRHRKDFMEREAKVYHQSYLEIVNVVEFYAQRNDLGLVVRFSGDPVDPNAPPNRGDTLRNINKPVIFQNGIDITQDVINLLNRQAQTARQPGAGAAGRR